MQRTNTAQSSAVERNAQHLIIISAPHSAHSSAHHSKHSKHSKRSNRSRCQTRRTHLIYLIPTHVQSKRPARHSTCTVAVNSFSISSITSLSAPSSSGAPAGRLTFVHPISAARPIIVRLTSVVRSRGQISKADLIGSFSCR